MAIVDDRQHLVGRQVLAAREQRVGDLDALVRRIDVVAAQHLDEGVARVRHWLHLGNHSKPKSGLSLIRCHFWQPAGAA